MQGSGYCICCCICYCAPRASRSACSKRWAAPGARQAQQSSQSPVCRRSRAAVAEGAAGMTADSHSHPRLRCLVEELILSSQRFSFSNHKTLFFPRPVSLFPHTLCSYHVLLSESISESARSLNVAQPAAAVWTFQYRQREERANCARSARGAGACREGRLRRRSANILCADEISRIRLEFTPPCKKSTEHGVSFGTSSTLTSTLPTDGRLTCTLPTDSDAGHGRRGRGEEQQRGSGDSPAKRWSRMGLPLPASGFPGSSPGPTRQVSPHECLDLSLCLLINHCNLILMQKMTNRQKERGFNERGLHLIGSYSPLNQPWASFELARGYI